MSNFLFENLNNIFYIDSQGNVSGLNFSGQNFIINGNSVVTTNQTGQFFPINVGVQTNRTLIDSSTDISVDWQNRSLNDSSQVTSIDWNGRKSYTNGAAGNIETLDWNNRILTGGVWIASGLWVGNSPVVTSSQTGGFGGSGTIITGYASGNSFGIYQPPLSLSSSQATGNYIIDWSKADHFYITLSGNTTFNFANTRDSLTIIVATYDTGSAYSVNFPNGTGQMFSGIKWQGGTGYIPIQTSGHTDIYTFTQFNSGIYASYVQNF